VTVIVFKSHGLGVRVEGKLTNISPPGEFNLADIQCGICDGLSDTACVTGAKMRAWGWGKRARRYLERKVGRESKIGKLV